MKSFKRRISMLTAITLIASFFQMNVSASELTRDEVIAQISKEAITSESAGAITNNLTLDSYGGLISWKSENPAISDTGTVTRPGGAVSSTGKIKAYYGDESEPVKTFDFAVAPAGTIDVSKNVQNNLQEDFETDFEFKNEASANDNGSAFGKNTFSLRHKTSVAENSLNVSAVTDSEKDSGKVLYAKYTATNAAYLNFYPGTELGKEAQRFAVSFDFKYTHTDAAWTNSKFVYTLYGVLPHASFEFNFVQNQFNVYHSDTSTYKTYEMPQNVAAGKWVHVDLDINLSGAVYDIYINGSKINSIPLRVASIHQTAYYYLKSIRNMTFQINKAGELWLDNVTIKEYSDTNDTLVDGALKNALLNYSNMEINGKTELEAETVLPYTPLENGYDTASLSWSGNGVDGNIFTPQTIGEAELTVTATAGNISKSQTVKVNVTAVSQREQILSQLKTDALTSESAGAITNNLTLDSYDGLVKWKSENPAISDAGVVTRPVGVTYSTGKIKAYYGDESEPVKTFDFAVAPAGTIDVSKNVQNNLQEDFETDFEFKNEASANDKAVLSVKTHFHSGIKQALPKIR